MSASSIPNLNDIRRGNRAPPTSSTSTSQTPSPAPSIPPLTGLRARAARSQQAASSNLQSSKSALGSLGSVAGPRVSRQDKIVQNTDVDASVSRVSAVDLGYLEDGFARVLCESAGEGGGQRRFPIINRGTYIRTTAIDEIVNRFLFPTSPSSTTNTPRQIISLGAGSDTRYFRLKKKYPSLQVRYHELDFATNTARKVRVVRSHPLFRGLVDANAEVSDEGTGLHAGDYHIWPVDLRDFAGEKDAGVPKLDHIDPDIPTLILSECCLIYLTPSHSRAILDHLTTKLLAPSTPCGLILYEPIRPHDAFGKTMVSNLGARGIQLQTLYEYSGPAKQRERFRQHSLVTGQKVADVDFIWERWISAREKERLGKLEMVDEVEEWRLLGQHYCVAWGWRDEVGGSDAGAHVSAFQGWDDLMENEADD